MPYVRAGAAENINIAAKIEQKKSSSRMTF